MSIFAHIIITMTAIGAMCLLLAMPLMVLDAAKNFNSKFLSRVIGTLYAVGLPLLCGALLGILTAGLIHMWSMPL